MDQAKVLKEGMWVSFPWLSYRVLRSKECMQLTWKLPGVCPAQLCCRLPLQCQIQSWLWISTGAALLVELPEQGQCCEALTRYIESKSSLWAGYAACNCQVVPLALNLSLWNALSHSVNPGTVKGRKVWEWGGSRDTSQHNSKSQATHFIFPYLPLFFTQNPCKVFHNFHRQIW